MVTTQEINILLCFVLVEPRGGVLCQVCGTTFEERHRQTGSNQEKSNNNANRLCKHYLYGKVEGRED